MPRAGAGQPSTYQPAARRERLARGSAGNVEFAAGHDSHPTVLIGRQGRVGGQVVLVRAFYRFEVWLPLIGPLLSNMANGSRMIVSTAAFRNEPF